MVRNRISNGYHGRLAQLDRALVSGTKGRGFNSRIAHHSFLVSKGISDMKKWIGPLISLLLTLILGIGLVSGSFSNLKQTSPGKAKTDRYGIIPAQDEREKEEVDPHMLQLLKEIQKKLDEWLKKLNDRIEREDVTRFGVRFLEVIRNILEWVKGKVDAKLESYEKEKPIKKKKGGIFRETHQEVSRFSNVG